MCINASKTKVMSALVPDEQRQAVLLDSEPLEDVEKFKYLGSRFVANGQGTEEIRSTINLARPAFSRLQSCPWSRREISLRTKDRVYQAEVRSILLYSCETLPQDVPKVSWSRTFYYPHRLARGADKLEASWRHGLPRPRPAWNRSPDRESSATHDGERTGWKCLVQSFPRLGSSRGWERACVRTCYCASTRMLAGITASDKKISSIGN